MDVLGIDRSDLDEESSKIDGTEVGLKDTAAVEMSASLVVDGLACAEELACPLAGMAARRQNVPTRAPFGGFAEDERVDDQSYFGWQVEKAAIRVFRHHLLDVYVDLMEEDQDSQCTVIR